MQNKELPLLGGCLYGELGFLPDEHLKLAKTYRDAVRLSWAARRIKGMKQGTLAERCPGMYASHVSDYLNASPKNEKGKDRRDLPARHKKAFQEAVGNRVISQWEARQEGLTLMEEMIALRQAA